MNRKLSAAITNVESTQLSKYQKRFFQHWDIIFTRASSELKELRKLCREERAVIKTQETAFWDFHRPDGNLTNRTKHDIRKCMKTKIFTKTDELKYEIELLRLKIEYLNYRKTCRPYSLCQALDNLRQNVYMYEKYDSFIQSDDDYNNVWKTETELAWTKYNAEITPKRVNKWKISAHELLKDPIGVVQFKSFLKSEFSSENLSFLLDNKMYKFCPISKIEQYNMEMFRKYIGPTAEEMINIDSSIVENIKMSIEKSPKSRNIYNKAAEHVLALIKSDSYTRFIKSNYCKNSICT
ncbi:Regulator of G-protein signaling 11 [Intoshia linei]|uniref:Regulator of G-protein signaling 11 n=1 Tax=Intoshia linei TaxID=1819745 RepID=A0A177ATK0_9BILA|nr:Regulator of G-protein signaling 11 [Intoshia linei]